MIESKLGHRSPVFHQVMLLPKAAATMFHIPSCRFSVSFSSLTQALLKEVTEVFIRSELYFPLNRVLSHHSLGTCSLWWESVTRRWRFISIHWVHNSATHRGRLPKTPDGWVNDKQAGQMGWFWTRVHVHPKWVLHTRFLLLELRGNLGTSCSFSC